VVRYGWYLFAGLVIFLYRQFPEKVLASLLLRFLLNL